jgi:putative flippase GtrA
MSNRLMGGRHIETPDSDPTGDLVAPAGLGAQPAQVKAFEPSYVPLGVAFLDSLLELADQLTRGKAGVLQRAVSYLMVGGFAACVNLVCLYVFNDLVPMPFSRVVHNVVAFLLASEISILANFIPNDRITFSHLPGHARSWWKRCVRFHSTAIAGTLVTFTVFSTLHIWLGVHTLIAESTGIIIALAFNFTFHHLWTYRHVTPAH